MDPRCHFSVVLWVNFGFSTSLFFVTNYCTSLAVSNFSFGNGSGRHNLVRFRFSHLGVRFGPRRLPVLFCGSTRGAYRTLYCLATCKH